MAESKSKQFDSSSFTELLKTVMTTTNSTQLGRQLSSRPEANGGSCNHDGTNHANVVMERPASDGYSWRKYGQKRVKSSESSRSYYRCTFCDCEAKKKVQHSDHSGHVIDVVYMGHHNHEPPQKKCTRSRRLVASGGNAAVGSDFVSPPPLQKLDGSVLALSWTDHRQPLLHRPESEQLSPGSYDGNAGPGVQKVDELEPKQFLCTSRPEPLRNGSHEFASSELGEKDGVESLSKRRMKERGVAHPVSDFKTVKEPQTVVFAAADSGALSDGYRWRKYGQKMVKGNSHPRSYYRCTCTGCPVRKHVERAADDTQSFIVTYEGKHNHDMPVSDKLHGAPPSPAHFVDATVATADEQCTEAETLAKQHSSVEQPLDREGDYSSSKSLEQLDEKALESAQTLLSIGTELRGC